MSTLIETVISRTNQFEYVEPEYECVDEVVCTTVPVDPPPAPDPPPGGSEPVDGPYQCLSTVRLLVDDPTSGASAGETIIVPCFYAQALIDAGLAV